MILSEALNEKRLERDGQRVETLRAGKGAGLLDQRVSKRGLLEESLETLEHSSQRPGVEVTVDSTDERNLTFPYRDFSQYGCWALVQFDGNR